MNEFYLHSFLQEFSQVKKRLTKTVLWIYIIPAIYFLLENKETINLSIGIFSLDGGEIILAIIPALYIGVYYYFYHLAIKCFDAFNILTGLAPKNEVKQEWLKFIQTSQAISSFANGFRKSRISRFSFYYPTLVILMVLPFSFLVYATINTILLTYNNFKFYYLVASILSIWFFCAIIYFIYKSPSIEESDKKRQLLLDKIKNSQKIESI